MNGILLKHQNMIIKVNQYNVMVIVHYIYWVEVKHQEIELLVIHIYL